MTTQRISSFAKVCCTFEDLNTLLVSLSIKHTLFIHSSLWVYDSSCTQKSPPSDLYPDLAISYGFLSVSWSEVIWISEVQIQEWKAKVFDISKILRIILTHNTECQAKRDLDKPYTSETISYLHYTLGYGYIWSKLWSFQEFNAKKRPKNLLCNGQLLVWFICKPKKCKEGVVKKENWELVTKHTFFLQKTQLFSPLLFWKESFLRLLLNLTSSVTTNFFLKQLMSPPYLSTLFTNAMAGSVTFLKSKCWKKWIHVSVLFCSIDVKKYWT